MGGVWGSQSPGVCHRQLCDLGQGLHLLEPLFFGIKWGDTHTALGEVVGGAAE